MRQQSLVEIATVLNAAQVRYLVVGGLAVVAHGYMRLTVDMDLVLSMDVANLDRAIQALQSLGYAPRAPVPFTQFADADLRKTWARDKQMQVFSIHSARHRDTEIDLFLEPPFDFEAATARSKSFDVVPGVAILVCGLADLMDLKTAAGRPKDLLDLAALRKIHLDLP